MPLTPGLSLCMIVKNEEAHLARCLRSVQGLVDDIVVVDTGSHDGTIEVARTFGARVSRVPWQDDFSHARNRALAEAAREWILVLDADESIAECDHDPIRACLERDDVNAVEAVQRHYLAQTVVGWQPGPGGYEEGRPYPGFVDITCRRLFRNRPWLRFRHPVHEALLSTDPARPLVLARAAWVIHHFGKVGPRDLLRAKGEAYLRIGARKAEQRPGDPQAHYELGVQYWELGRAAEALDCFERVEALAPGYRDTPIQQALCHLHLKEYSRALASLAIAARTLPRHAAEIALEQGNVYRAIGKEAAAEQAFTRALSLNAGFSAASLNLALLWQSQGRRGEALACLDRALAVNEAHREMRLLRAVVRHEASDDEGALADLERLGADAAAHRLRARILTARRRFAEARECLIRLGHAPDAALDALRGAVALGLGELADAARLLERSMDAAPAYEAARNLSTVREALGDRAGATHAAAWALGLSEDEAACARFRRLTGDTLASPRPREEDSRAIIFFCDADAAMRDPDARLATHAPRPCVPAIEPLAAALAARGYRAVIFAGGGPPEHCSGLEYADRKTFPLRCLAERPDVVVSIGRGGIVKAVRLAPLQIGWPIDPAHDAPALEPAACVEIDAWWQCAGASGDESGAFALVGAGVPPALSAAAARADRPATNANGPARMAETWDAFIRAAMAPEPDIVRRMAVHLAAGRAGLALRMIARQRTRPELAAVWADLAALAAWHAGEALEPPREVLTRLALRCPSVRRAGLAVPPADRQGTAPRDGHPDLGARAC